MKILTFITAIPWDVRRGSGCYVGIMKLLEALRGTGIGVDVIRPVITTPVYTATRLLFNESLRRRRFSSAATIGIDADGYAIPRGRNSPPHIACIKGVLGDVVRFEAGAARASLALQASLEGKHARRADLVITVSRYCAERLEELYGVRDAIVVPELIDLNAWRDLFRANPAEAAPGKFTIPSVCRFCPRKRLDILLRAAGLLRKAIPELEIRIAGETGPNTAGLRALAGNSISGRSLGGAATLRCPAWLRNTTVAMRSTCPACRKASALYSWEAMAAGKPIVAARAAAIPEVVRSGILAEPENPEALADAIGRLYRDPDLRRSLGFAGLWDVEQFEMNRVAVRFLAEIAKVAPVLLPEERKSDECTIGAAKT